MAFDVGAITREIQSTFRLFSRVSDDRSSVLALQLQDEGAATNLATPRNVAVLLAALRRLTQQITFARAGMSDLIPDAAIVLFDLRMVAWRQRLVAYESDVTAAPPDDRKEILWSTTAPLLLGFYGGETSTDPQSTIDAITPFSLANQLEVTDEWRDERWALFKDDLAKGVKGIATAIGGGLVAAVGVGLAVLLVLNRRRK